MNCKVCSKKTNHWSETCKNCRTQSSRTLTGSRQKERRLIVVRDEFGYVTEKRFGLGKDNQKIERVN